MVGLHRLAQCVIPMVYWICRVEFGVVLTMLLELPPQRHRWRSLLLMASAAAGVSQGAVSQGAVYRGAVYRGDGDGGGYRMKKEREKESSLAIAVLSRPIPIEQIPTLQH